MSTPKPKRVRAPVVKRDPVITALIAKLPPEGGNFDYSQRVNWLRMVAMAFDGAFGVVSAIAIDSASRVTITGADMPSDLPNVPTAKPAPIAAAAEPDEIRYFVDTDGYARRSPGNVRIKPFDIPAGAELEDERTDDEALDTIKWQDGLWPPAAYAGHPLMIVKA